MDKSAALPPIRTAADQIGPASPGRQWIQIIAIGGLLALALIVTAGVAIALIAPPREALAILAVGGMILAFLIASMLPVAGVIAMVGLLARQASQAQVQLWTQFAQRVGGEVVIRPVPLFGYPMAHAVLFSFSKTPCVLDIETVGSGKHKRHFTRLTFDLGRPTAFTCQIVPQHGLSFVAQWFGGQDVRLGWDDFDHRYIVKTNDELRAPDILDHEIRLALLDLRRQVGQSTPLKVEGGYVDLAVHSGRVQIRALAHPRQLDQLLAHAASCGRLFDLLAVRVM
jgi:hypothetical protein